MLYIIPTPIGNLRDITLRALDALKEADFIACEDTRRAKKLLNTYEIEKPLIVYQEHSGPAALAKIMQELLSHKKIALISDSGTPLVSDPGFKLAREVRQQGIQVEVLPGPSAVVTALVTSGLPVDSFAFFGFLPPKSTQRLKALKGLTEREETLIFYESPYRVGKVLQDMLTVFGVREAVLARELTKKFEQVLRGDLPQLVEYTSKKKMIGEIVILISGKGRKNVLTM